MKGLGYKSIGTASVICRFTSEPFMTQPVQFFVFEKLQCEVLFGREFLRATQTLDIYQHRLRSIESTITASAAVRSISHVGECLKCWLDGIPVRSLPDTGANVNLISSEFAEILDYHNGPGGKTIQVGEQVWIEFADCSTARIEGTIQLTVSFCPPKETNGVLKLIESSGSSANKTPARGIKALQSNINIIEPFHIIKDLSYDVILGETILTTVDAYNQHSSGFSTPEKRKEGCIAIARKKKPGEGTQHPKTLRNPEQKFRDKFSLEYDRYQREKESHEDERLHGRISDKEAQIKCSQTDQNHLEWLRMHREPLE
ncbi:hypothetical protein B7463_g3288, partial [Scytalidium lignicola]